MAVTHLLLPEAVQGEAAVDAMDIEVDAMDLDPVPVRDRR